MMIYADKFIKQVELLLACMPFIKKQECFALKGGTALNLFMHNLPRLSVDIDLAYVRLDDRESALAAMQKSLLAIKQDILKAIPKSSVAENLDQHGKIIKLTVYANNCLVKIEPNFINRGTVFPIEYHALCPKASEYFKIFIDEVPMLAVADLYAGKICAALSRQHPRDLFDIKLMFETIGLNGSIRQSFIIMLASSPRPMHELLNPNLLDISDAFAKDFLNMTEIQVSLEELLIVRARLIYEIRQSLTEQEKLFLLSLKQGEPKYHLLPFPHLAKMPAVQWKLLNIKKLDKRKHKVMVDKLIQALELDLVPNN